MFVRVRLYGTLRRLSQPQTMGRWQGEIPEGARIEDLIRLLGTQPGEVYVASINGQLFPFDAAIPDGAEVILAPPVGGGCVRRPLVTDIPASTASLSDRQSGTPGVRQEST